MLLVDFRKSYDSIHRESLLNILKDFKFPRKIINLIRASLNHTDIQVKIGNGTSQPTRVTTGLRQGGALSPVLFNLVLERVIREMNTSEGVILGQIRIRMLAYADDIALLGEDLDMIKRLESNLINTAKKVGLTVNEKKTEYLVASRRNRNGGREQYIKIEELKFKRVSQFKYLGTMMTEDKDIKTEVSTRIQLANREYYGLEKVLKSKSLSKALKIKMYMTLLRPIVLYDSETWALRKTEESRLMIFERKVLRKMFGPIYDRQTNEWRKLHNVELQGLFHRPNIVSEIVKRKLSWAGHAWCKQGTLVKWVIEEEPNRKRPLGIPKLRWENSVKRKVEKIEPGVKWREVAEDRDRWQSLTFSGWS
jgi:hypothetical protein